MPDLIITPVDTGFPAGFSGTPSEFADQIFANMAFTINSDNLILGKIGGSAPLTNVGLWLNNGAIWVWTGSKYEPANIVIGDETNQATFSTAALTADRTLTFPDKDGIIALTTDISGGRATVTIPSTVIDWSLSETYFRSMTGNTTFTMSNSLPGQTIYVLITRTGSFSPTFTAVSWEGGTPPTPSATVNKQDLYIFTNVAGIVYGDAKLDMS